MNRLWNRIHYSVPRASITRLFHFFSPGFIAHSTVMTLGESVGFIWRVCGSAPSIDSFPQLATQGLKPRFHNRFHPCSTPSTLLHPHVWPGVEGEEPGGRGGGIIPRINVNDVIIRLLLLLTQLSIRGAPVSHPTRPPFRQIIHFCGLMIRMSFSTGSNLDDWLHLAAGPSH